MKDWVKTIRGAFLMGLAWAIAWAPVAIIIGVTIIDPDNSMDEMWVVVGAYPGFLCGVLFYAMADPRRRLTSVSLSRAAALGAVAGLIVGALPYFVATSTQVGITALVVIIIGSAISGAVSIQWLPNPRVSQ